MPDGVTVRAARAEDVEACVDVLAAVAAEPDLMLGWDPPFERDEIVKQLLAWVADASNAVIVAEADGANVGSLWVIARKGAGEIRLIVAQGWRDRGVGREMIEEGIRWARARGLRKVWLGVYPENARAVALYERCGFVVEGVQRRHELRPDGRMWDRMLMGRHLDGAAQ